MLIPLNHHLAWIISGSADEKDFSGLTSPASFGLFILNYFGVYRPREELQRYNANSTTTGNQDVLIPEKGSFIDLAAAWATLFPIEH